MILSIVIPVFNKYNFTKACLNDLSKLPKDHEIIVIDNASSDETKSQLEGSKEIIYVRNEENTFHSKACNQGYNLSKGANVLFFNNDIRVKSDHSTWTKEIIDNCKDAIVGPTMGQLDKELNFVQEANKELTGNSYLSGWCIASSKENWNKLDMSKGEIWNEKFPFYFNDTDLSFRCRKLQIPLKVVAIPVVHFGKVSASQINVHKLYTEGRKTFLNYYKK